MQVFKNSKELVEVLEKLEYRNIYTHTASSYFVHPSGAQIKLNKDDSITFMNNQGYLIENKNSVTELDLIEHYQ